MRAIEFKVIGGTADKSFRWSYAEGKLVGAEAMFFRLEQKMSCRVKDLEDLAIADEANGVRIMGAVRWGTVGAVIAGPVGAIVGGVLGGRGEKITFVAKFPDEMTMMAQVPKKVWLSMLAERL